VRVFVATDIDDNTRAAVGELQRRLAAEANLGKGDVKWVRPEAMHLTLKFLGEVQQRRLPVVCEAVERAVQAHTSFELDIESVGCFGGRNARVLWVGTGNGSDRLEALQRDVEQQLAAAGWPEENRKFTGHLTLCRVRSKKAAVELARLAEAYKDFRAGQIEVAEVSVYESQLTPKGPIYTRLSRYSLE